jgi:hypothetical protein
VANVISETTNVVKVAQAVIAIARSLFEALSQGAADVGDVARGDFVVVDHRPNVQSSRPFDRAAPMHALPKRVAEMPRPAAREQAIAGEGQKEGDSPFELRKVRRA